MQFKTEQKNIYSVECRDKDGNLKWSEEIENLVTNEGLNDQLSKYYKGSAYTAAFFLGLASATPIFSAADVMATHAGWSEITDYSESVRQTLTLGAVAAQAVNNSASKAVFTANANVTLGGVFITTNSTKGGTIGLLIAGGAFTGGNQSVGATDTVSVTCSLANASA